MRIDRTATLIGIAVILASAIPALADPVAHYRCADGSIFTATFTPPGAAEGSVTLAYKDGRNIVLPQVLSADGGRYVKGDTEFWIKGNGGTLTIAGKATTCKAKT
jgi:membrane-bound inhibitor of C-type lysozyme